MNTKYIMLMSSLPYLGNLFEVKQPAISRLKLKSRLKLLRENDEILLHRIASLLGWSRQSPERTDARFVAEANGFLEETHSSTLHELLERHFDILTIMAAFRRRQRGENQPPVGQSWGVGRWGGYIERHWMEPNFRLEGMFPWAPEANRLLSANDLTALERLLAGVNWNMLDRLGAGHEFDFDAVVIYVSRWELVNRCCSYNREAAVQRFRELVDSGIEEFKDILA